MATTRGTLTANFRVQRQCSVFVILIIIYEIVIISGNVVHLTMVTPTPYGAGRSRVSFSCFRSSPDTNVDLSFGRPFMIGIPGSTIQSATTLPDGSLTYLSTTPSYVTRQLPDSADSTGLFYCEGSNSGMTTRVYSIIHSYTRSFEPVDGLVTKTINKGEDVTLSVSSVNGLGTGPVWRRIRNGIVDDLNSVSGQNTLTITLSSVDVMDGDLFAVVQTGVTTRDNHFGMIRLIVRGCSAGQWGPPACTGRCNQCYNGGVCDDETGQCICAPGFSGTNCLTACGMHKFGWACEFQCGFGNLVASCTGSQFGLPDPYGSSCISGYSGRDCDTECTAGKFGAGCTETCHCQSGGTCNVYTGACSSGCATGWSGRSCQVPVNIVGCPTWTVTVPGVSATQATWTEPTATDASGRQITNIMKSHQPGDVFNIEQSTQVTYTFTASSGDQATCVFNVSVYRAVNIMNCPSPGVTVTETIHVGVTRIPVSWTEPTATDRYNQLITNIMKTHQPGDSFNVGESIAVIYTFIDDTSGLQDTCTFSVTVNLDNIPPVVACPDNIAFEVPFGANGRQVTWQQPTVSDNSGNFFFVSSSNNPNDFFSVGSTIVTYTYRDGSNNQNSCSFTVLITAAVDNIPPVVLITAEVDNEPPVVTCPDNIAFEVPFGGTGRQVTWQLPTVSDNSGNFFFVSSTNNPNDFFSVGSNIVTYTYSDAASNQNSCSFTVLITAAATNVPPPAGSSTIIIVIINVIVIVVILVIVCLVYFLRVRKRRRQHSRPQESTQNQEMTGYENTITPVDVINASATDYEPVGQNQTSINEPVGDIHSSPTYEDVGLPTWAKPWSVPWDNVMVGTKVLGKGQFGEVRYGGVMIEGEFCKAAIKKKLRERASPVDRQNFLDEFRSMTKIRRHPNVVRILGACQHEGELYVAMEYLPNGDLRSYLRNARSMDGEESLSSDKLLQFALDVAKGMQHLATSGVIHRDLAARNILLDGNLIAKISDFGLSRGEDIYVQASKTRVPTRWLSLESMTNKTYTTKSDVWSYGILLWEIATVGGTPYPGIQTGVLRSKLKTGYRMPKPTNCDIKIYDLMLKCWQEKPDERPSFKKIVSVLTTMTENQDDEIYMSLLPRSEEHKYVNISPEFDDN
ncbi:tyrosine-protein kinase receptor Tie-2-like isoform X2 [Asterias rubens]|uniref:tyrosine-protein kinase receptor Tie-2-like isoform X2 n=1 Tax=Asterias rubens TaxID=7604 RepID=UPI001455890F|nr:tyrosine-protein kinase receptor Tie-2-like isoform X2 [Asterias rubens]